MVSRRAHKTARRLSARQLLAVAPLAAVVAAAFLVAVQVSAAGAFRDSLPQIALRFQPSDGAARARLAGTLASGASSIEVKDAVRALATEAIRRDPLNPVAVRALGWTVADGINSPAYQNRAANLFLQADRLSRRDVQTQVWLVEYYLQRNDLPAVLRHFDIALRTSSQEGQGTLFPLLAAATEDDRLAQALISRMRRKPDWAVPFAGYLTEGQVPLDRVSYIYSNTLDPAIPEENALIVGLMQQLAAKGEFHLARQLFGRFYPTPGKTGELVNDGSFEGGRKIAPFSWSLVEDPDLWAVIEPSPGHGNVLKLSASQGHGGEVARQLLQLAPGTYRLAAKTGNVPLESYQRPRLSIRCAEGSGTTAIDTRPTSPGDGVRTLGGTFSIGPGCAFQWIAVSISGGDTEPTDLPWIDDITISRSAGIESPR